MSFICNSCNAKAIELDLVIVLGPDDDSDEVSFQTARCHACDPRFLAVYEESRRGSGDSWNHDAWPVDVTTLAEVEALIRACATPRDHRCGCASHATFRDRGFQRYLQKGWFRLRTTPLVTTTQ